MFILRDLCQHGGEPALCEAFVEYARTGDARLVAIAAGIASPDALEAARERAVAAGVIPREAIL
jgi:hypothetical protein